MKKFAKLFTFIVLMFLCFISSCKDEQTTQPENQPPEIQNLTSNPSTTSSNRLPAGGEISFLVNAIDPDKDQLIYTWECTGGSFIEGQNTNNVKWKATINQAIAQYDITVNVSDGAKITKEYITVYVAAAVPNINVSLTTLNFGSNIDTIQIKIFNKSLGTLNWQIINLASWMNASPASGSISQPTDTVLSNIIVNRASLNAGNYNHTMKVVNTNDTTNNISVSVSMIVPTTSLYGYVEGYTYYAGTTISVSGVTVNIEDKYYTTSIAGYYRLNDILPGNKILIATKEGYDTFQTNITVVQNVNTKDIEMTSALYTHNLYGTILSAGTLQPLQDVLVTVLNDDGSMSQLQTSSDFNGYYQVPTVPQGQRTIRFEKQNYKTLTPEIFMSNSNYLYDVQLLNKPGIPSNPSPADNSTNLPISLTLNWSCIDPNGDALNYDIYFGTDNPPTQIVSQNQTTTSLTRSGLSHYTTYYWKVKAKDNFNNSTEGPIWSFLTTLSTPTLLSPSNGATNIPISPTLSWSTNPNATSYTLQVSTNSSFTSFVYNANVGNVTSQQLSGLNNAAIYYWRVAATNSSGTSDWSSVWFFTTAGLPQPPTLSSPANGAANISLPPVLNWNASPAANSYRLQVSTNDQFTNIVYDLAGLTNTNQQVNSLLESTQYYWRVNATNNNGTSGWSNVFNFTTVSLILISPANGSTDISLAPTLSWNLSASATSYTLQVSTNSSFTSFIYNANVGNVTNQQLNGLNNSTTYYWRINAINSSGTSDWSAVWSFTTGDLPQSPTLLSPANAAVNISLPSVLSWNTSPNISSYRLQVSTSDQFTNIVYDQSGLTATSQQVTGLNYYTNYYWRVSATNSFGTSNWSNVWSFLTANETGTLTDIDGNIYQTVKIGNQWWMAENLRVTRYQNGDSIPNVTNSSNWYSLSTGAYCAYDNNNNNVSTYGLLYNWSAADDSRNIAPAGWHVPSDAEWQTLMVYLGGSSIAGGKMKEPGYAHWISPNNDATNSSGFTALPGGSRYPGGSFLLLGSSANFWSSTEYGSNDAWRYALSYGNSELHRFDVSKGFGYSVRLVKD